MTYDPEQTPDRDAWLATDESERIAAVQHWHEQAKIRLPNALMHALFHVIVENQLALNLDSVSRAIPRLMRQGLSRHDAVHAIAWVLSSYLHQILSTPPGTSLLRGEVLARYNADLGRLTARAWLEQWDSF